MTAADLIGRGPLLLDFDGPICSIFAGYPAPDVARHLVGVLHAEGVDPPAAVVVETDPLEVLRWTGKACPQALVVTVEDALCVAEVRAAATASPTPYGHEVIQTAWRAGVPIAIVSNNSQGAIEAYLRAHNLFGCVRAVIGRPYAKPELMKPHPSPVLLAARSLMADVEDCVLIGDSLSDIEGARAAGAHVIGYANREWKVDAFHSADSVITSMVELIALRD
ncbi:HAD family hydrolase [Dactylosporangium sp. CA-233914]|uniref:HAD family hydrolase n=1 Tax=Dactylosporangium sp. CA-233914 TaxID=3239934 RepID=UPI003D922122